MVISENTEDTGSFFGRIDGTIMDSLVQDRIYRRVALMDYQGACSDHGGSSVAAGDITRPSLIKWFFDSVVVIGMSWLSMMPGSSYAWPQRFPDYEPEEIVDPEDYPSYEEEDDYHTNDVVTVPEIVSRSSVSQRNSFNFFLFSSRC